MKTIILLFIVSAFISRESFSQGTDNIQSEIFKTESAFYINDSIKEGKSTDTTIVRVGKKDVKVVEHQGGTEFLIGKDKNKKSKADKFKGHWQGVEIGFNSFDQVDYSGYNSNDFMSLNQGKSIGVNLNFYELNIGLAKSYAGLVSGLGLSFNDYRFENPYTITKGIQRTEPVHLNYSNLSKSKLAVSYLTVPLLLEFQIPVNQKEGRLYVNAGVIGGVKIGSHTKVKHGDTKDKDRSGFNINSFKYDATFRVGYKDVGLFVNYSLTPLFQENKGPALTPFTVGISFLD